MLAKRREAEGYLFLAPSGKPWEDAEPGRAFLSAAYKAAGLRRPGVLWHSLRHSYASILAAGGIREDVVAVLMGHKRRGTTSIYTHLFADAFDGVEEALDQVLGGVNETSMACSVHYGAQRQRAVRRQSPRARSGAGDLACPGRVR